MIVKVQRSLRTSADCPQMLIYNEDRSVMFDGDLTNDVDLMLGFADKRFFHAKLVDGEIVLGLRSTEQNW